MSVVTHLREIAQWFLLEELCSLKVAPADLTLLKRRNNGKFPSAKVGHVLDGAEVVAHGSSEMPVWGPIFRSLDPSNAAMAKLRIANVIKYLESMQE